MKKINQILILSTLFLVNINVQKVNAETSSIQDKINNANDNEIVSLNENLTSLTVPSEKNITIDFNGYKINTLTNNGILKLIDNKNVGGIYLTSSISETALALANYGSLTIDNININVTTDATNSYPVSIHNYANASLSILDGNISSIAEGNSYAFGIDNEGDLLIEGGSISSYIKSTTAGGNNSIGIHNHNNGKVSIKGGNIYAESSSNNGYATAIRNQNTSSIELIEGGNISSYVDNASGQAKAYGIYNLSGTIKEITGGTIKGKTEACQWSFGIWNTSKIENIRGGNIIAEINHSKNSPNAISLANDKTIDSISGGVFYAKSTCPNGGTFNIRTRNANSIISSISGGAYFINKVNEKHYIYNENGGVNTFKTNYKLTDTSSLTNYRYVLSNEENIVEEYKDNENIMTGTIFNNSTQVKEYKLIGTEISKAMIDNVNYSTINEALNEVKEGQTIILTGDIEEKITINKNIILDLNGHTINNTIINQATLLIKDSTSLGRIFLESQENTTLIGIDNYGSLTIEDVSIRVNGLGKDTINHGIYNRKNSTLTIKNCHIRCVSKDVKFGHGIVNEGTINNIYNGTIESYSLSTNTASNLVGIANTGTIKEINNGIIYAQSYGKNGFAIGIRNQSNATIEKISGGLIKGYVCSSIGGSESKGFGIYNQSGTINLIEGGKIEGRSTAAQWAFGIWNPANSTIKEIKEGEIYALGEHNYQNSSPNFIALSNEGNVNIISGGLFYASSLHEKGSTFAIRNRGIISSLEGGRYYVSKENNELLRNENGTLNIKENYTMKKLNSQYNYLTYQEIVCEILDENNNYLASNIYSNHQLISSHGTYTKKGYCIEGFSINSFNSEITLNEDNLSTLEESTSVYVHYIDAPKFYFLGSSVTYGFATNGVSFVNEIQNTLNCTCTKEAISGTTLTDNGPSSYVERMENNFSKNEKIEHLIVQLSTNDISQNKPLGIISDSNEISSFNKQTVLGAMEYIIAYAKKTWNCEVTFYTNPKYNNANYENLITKLYEIQNKWNIGIIDFYYYKNMDALDNNTLSSYMSDAIHPNSKGYAWMGKIMSEYLKASFAKKHPNIKI